MYVQIWCLGLLCSKPISCPQMPFLINYIIKYGMKRPTLLVFICAQYRIWLHSYHSAVASPMKGCCSSSCCCRITSQTKIQGHCCVLPMQSRIKLQHLTMRVCFQISPKYNSRVTPQVAENKTVIALGIALAPYSQCQNATSHAKHIICRS